MGDDRAILRENWDGRIPVCFSLAEDEIEQEKPENVFAHVPRQSYFPLVTEKVSKYFSQHVDKEKVGEMWLECDGQPLKWHYPIGVLYDMYGHLDSGLPWKLTMHFQEFPESELLHCPGREAVESVFMSTVKEADALKHRSSIINSMQKKDHKNMWMGVVNDRFDQFWPINKKLMENTDEESIKYIPFRIYQSETGFIQKLFRPFSEEGQEHTLDDLIKHVLPDLDEDGNKRVLIQGIEVPGETPILWLSEHLSYPDNFLHICVVNQPSMTISDHW
ncbi:autophagy protein 5-like [Mya arenaria]|uniref:autophagy protein 5-like n=1 Tax=Mya arenaria TaxID=6604 RepID=UPI0022E93CF5|nr:autophagy protein 5-like [Mya arenaria]